SLVVGMLLAGSLCLVGCQKAEGEAKSETVLELGGYAITEEHLALYEQDNRAAITSYYYQNYGLDSNAADFWETEVDGETPAQKLREQAMDEVALDTVERIEAVEHGISTPVTLEEIKEAMEEENEKRQTASVVYGISEYGLMEYISRTKMDTENALMEVLLEDELAPTDEELQSVYEAMDPLYFDKGFQAKVGVYMYHGVKVGEYPSILSDVWELVYEEISNGSTSSEILNKVKESFDIELSFDEVEFDSNEIGKDNDQMDWLLEQVRGKEVGWISTPLNYQASQGVLHLYEMESDGVAEWREAKPLLTNFWIQQEYPKYLQEKLEELGYPKQ
ncbi:MAG: hypothetical protein Q4D90_09610, partial [bacterium]|nr:hypothetical protein [bacterium]